MGKRVQGEAKENRRQQGYVVEKGPSILESIENRLIKAVAAHHKAVATAPVSPWNNDKNQTKVDQTRGVVRGLAFAVATIRFPYEQNSKALVLNIEREFGL